MSRCTISGMRALASLFTFFFIVFSVVLAQT
jgi:hypothetical protein